MTIQTNQYYDNSNEIKTLEKTSNPLEERLAATGTVVTEIGSWLQDLNHRFTANFINNGFRI